MKQVFLFITTVWFALHAQSQQTRHNELSLNGFKHWITGRDKNTEQLLPTGTENGLTIEERKTIAHVRFKVKQYGELSFPINPATFAGTEALAVDLSQSRFIKLRYKANRHVVLQLRQTGVHGGKHNHIILPPSDKLITRTIYFSSFAGGLKPLDLKDVAKFNFAFLGNNPVDGFADLVVTSFKIDRYKP